MKENLLNTRSPSLYIVKLQGIHQTLYHVSYLDNCFTVDLGLQPQHTLPSNITGLLYDKCAQPDWS